MPKNIVMSTGLTEKGKKGDTRNIIVEAGTERAEMKKIMRSIDIEFKNRFTLSRCLRTIFFINLSFLRSLLG